MWRFRAPAAVPDLAALVLELGLDARAIARHLAVAERTVYHWLSTGKAPRAALLALFWETRWGQSIVEAEAVNAARVHAGYVAALEREVATLRARIARLEATGDFGSANAPAWISAGPAPTVAESTP